MARHGSLAEQLAELSNEATAPKSKKRVAANDNKPKKEPPPRYRGTLPALRWLWDNHPDLAPAVAGALPRQAANWFMDVEPTRQEIRPTVGELIAASQDDDGKSAPQTYERHGRSCHVTLGRLKFRDGLLTEWGVTKKGKKLKPTDRPRSTEDKSHKTRKISLYLETKPTTKSPFEADHLHRSISKEPAIASMYDPLPGVEAARALLASLGVDGSKQARDIPVPIAFGPLVPADGAGFLGGVSSPSGNSSEGAIMWDAPEDRKSSAASVIEEVAASGTLKSIGLRLGYSEGYADRAGKAALLELAEILSLTEKHKKSA